MQLSKIGVFIDGNYFFHVSNFYNYEHPRRARISISGIHNFVREFLARAENTPVNYFQVIDSHYFRGRMRSVETQEVQKLFAERTFEDYLMKEGVIMHYLPLRLVDGRFEEKGIDVLLALETYELAMLKKLDAVVLVACDGDYSPLVRKLNALGTKVMVLAWDFQYTDSRTGKNMSTITSRELLSAATYPLLMDLLIDRKDPLTANLFVERAAAAQLPSKGPKRAVGTIQSLKNGYGFIAKEPNNVFFHWSELENGDFNDLRVGDKLEYLLVRKENGQEVATKIHCL
jgi:uncharacterized LabA/DUF88 family protein/cold shock CspA family protein